MYFLFHPIAFFNHLIARLVTDKITFFLSIAAFVFLSLNYKNAYWETLDKNVSQWAKTSEEGYIKRHAEEFALFGNALFHIIFCFVLAIIFFAFKHEPDAAVAILFVLIFSWAFNRLVKIIYKRERPRHVVGNIRRRLSYCFPSGHIMASIPIYFFSAVILQVSIPFLPWYIIAFFMTLLIILSRIYLNHHYFTDVLGGIALGIFCLNISIWFYFCLGLV